MGTASSIENLEVWQPAGNDDWEIIENAGYCNVVRHLATGEEAEEYAITLDGKHSLFEEFQRYEYRYHQNQNLVSVLSAYRENGQYLCSGSDLVRVRTERIPYRLSDVQNISHGEILLILQEALVGFKTIFERHGPVRIDENMIGFTPLGKVKVWLCDNFAKNSPDEHRHKFSRSVGKPSQSSMITDLFQEVEVHSAGKRYPSMFKARYEEEHIQTFFEASAFLHEYSEEERVEVPAFVRLPRSIQHHGLAFQKRNNYRIPNIVLNGVPRIDTEGTKYRGGERRIATEAFSSRATKDTNSNVLRRIAVIKEDDRTQQVQQLQQQRLLKHKSSNSMACMQPLMINLTPNNRAKGRPLHPDWSQQSQHQPTNPYGSTGTSIRQERGRAQRQVSVERLRTLPNNEQLKVISRTNPKQISNGLKPTAPLHLLIKPSTNQSGSIGGTRILDRLVAQRR